MARKRGKAALTKEEEERVTLSGAHARIVRKMTIDKDDAVLVLTRCDTRPTLERISTVCDLVVPASPEIRLWVLGEVDRWWAAKDRTARRLNNDSGEQAAMFDPDEYKQEKR